jgi:hypothetical protein
MDLIALALTMLVPVLVAIYTFNYGRWAWQNKLRRGGVGLYFLALLTVAVPGLVVWWNR